MSVSPNTPFILPRYLFLSSYEAHNEQHRFVFEHGQKKYAFTLSEAGKKVLLCFTAATSPQAVAQELNMPLHDVIQICIPLITARILIVAQNVSTFERYDRHLLFYTLNGIDPIQAQQKLRGATITLLGMGGIGNWVALNLVGLGLGSIRMIDGDDIEESNLTRQVLFTEDDVGRKKVTVAKEALQKRNSQTRFEAISTSVSQDNIRSLLSGSDFVVLSADSPPFLIQAWTNQACAALEIPFFNVGYFGEIGVVGPMVCPFETGCLACSTSMQEKDEMQNSTAIELRKRYQAPSFGALNATISSFASLEIIKLLLSFGEVITKGTQLQFNPLTFQTTKIPYTKNEECQVCSQQLMSIPR